MLRAPMSDLPVSKPSWWKLLFIPLLAGLGLMAILSYGGVDMKLARAAFDFTARRWKYGEMGFWHWFFQFGPMPMLAVGFAALLLLFGSFADPRLARFRKAALYVVLSLSLGSGMLANFVFKEGWGRPRPSQVDGFSLIQDTPGMPYLTPFCPAFGQDGKSFPCGHATTGFGLSVLAFVLWRSRRRCAIIVFILSYGYGLLIGVARMLQGGHFASDVVAAALLCHVTQAVLYQVMDLYRKPEWQVTHKPSRLRRAVAIGIPVVGVLTLAALLVTPYREPLEISADSLAKAEQDATKLSIETFGKIHLDLGAEPQVKGIIKGFGLPQSRTKFALFTQSGNARFFEIERGWFSELHQELSITLPLRKTLEVDLSSPKRHATWDIDLREFKTPLNQTWAVHGAKGGNLIFQVAATTPVVIQRRLPGTTEPKPLFEGPGPDRIVITIDGPVEPQLRVK